MLGIGVNAGIAAGGVALAAGTIGAPITAGALGAAALVSLLKDAKQLDGPAVAEIFLKQQEAAVAAQREMHVSIRDFHRDFEKLVQTLEVKRLVVIVDDLDRCLPPSVIETLEAIRLFLAAPKTAFVIAADEALIREAMRPRQVEGQDALDRVAGPVRDGEGGALGPLLPRLALQGMAELEEEELLQDEPAVRGAARGVEQREVVVLPRKVDPAQRLRARDDLQALAQVRRQRVGQVVGHRLREAEEHAAQGLAGERPELLVDGDDAAGVDAAAVSSLSTFSYWGDDIMSWRDPYASGSTVP